MSLSALQIKGLLQEDKVRHHDEMPAIIHDLRKAGVYVALAQGVFDIMHARHVGYLREASRNLYKDGILIVGVENDATVSLNKGVNRPVNPVADRMLVLSEFTSIQLVFTYRDTPRYNRPQDYIDRYRDLRPHAVVVPSFDPHMELKQWHAEESGTRLATVHYKHLNSTTTMLKKIGYED